MQNMNKIFENLDILMLMNVYDHCKTQNCVAKLYKKFAGVDPNYCKAQEFCAKVVKKIFMQYHMFLISLSPKKCVTRLY